MKMHRSNTIDRCLALLRHVICDTNHAKYITDADLVYVAERAKREGLEFLTVVLPKLGKHLEACLGSSQWTPLEGFGKTKNSDLPKLCRSALLHIFEDGRPRCMPYTVCVDSVDLAEAVQAVRQFTLLFYKLEQPPSKQQIADSLRSFLETERDVGDWIDSGGVQHCSSHVIEMARALVCSVIGSANPGDILPRHGSGASACKTKPWERYGVPRYSEKLNSCYPYCDFFTTQPGGWDEDWLREAPTHTELNARIAFVPKDSRGPRTISAEPREHMYIQQGQMDTLYEEYERHKLARYQVSCRDQSRNRALARYGSITGKYASIDMKEASDRVTPELVQALFPHGWFTHLMATRSEYTEFPDGTKVKLRKFAPMGSAVCFPVEAICFWAIAVSSVCIERGLSLEEYTATHSCEPNYDLWWRSSAVSVFGDDILVPSDLAVKVCENLEACGLKVNYAKSYFSGPFRESCGGDYVLGHDVGIERLKHLPIELRAPVKGRLDQDAMHAAFRTKDFLNRVALRYGTWLGNRTLEVFRDLYDLPTVAVDYFNVVDDDGLMAMGPFLGFLADYTSQLPPQKKRRKGRKWQMWTFKETSVDCEVDTSGWSWVLRAMVTGSRDRKIDGGPDRAHAGIVTIAKRHRYTLGWVSVNKCPH